MTQQAGKRGGKEPPLTKTRGRGIRYCCLREDCDKCFRSSRARAGHMGTGHGARTYTRTPFEHGTVTGYRREISYGDDTCEPCRRAWREHMRTVERAKRAAGKGRTQERQAQMQAKVFDNGKWVLLAEDIPSE